MENNNFPTENESNESNLDMKVDTGQFLKVQVVKLFCYQCSQQFDTLDVFNSHHRSKTKTSNRKRGTKEKNKNNVKSKVQKRKKQQTRPTSSASSRVRNPESVGEVQPEEEKEGGSVECNNNVIITKWKCESCPLYFSAKGCLKRHVRSHHGEEAPFLCMCGLEYFRADNYRTHLEKGGKHQVPDFRDETQMEILRIRIVKIKRKELEKIERKKNGTKIPRKKGKRKSKSIKEHPEPIKSEIDKSPNHISITFEDDITNPEFTSSYQNDSNSKNSNDALENNENNNNIDILINDNDFSPSLPNDIFSSDHSDQESYYEPTFLPVLPEPLLNNPTFKKSKKESPKKKETPPPEPSKRRNKRKSLYGNEDGQVKIKIDPSENEEYNNINYNSSENELDDNGIELNYKEDSNSNSEVESDWTPEVSEKSNTKTTKGKNTKAKKNKHNKDDEDYERTLMKTHRYRITTEFQCLACFKYFVSEETLQNHISFNSESNRMLSCPEESCDLQFELRCEYNRHVRSQHPKLWKEKKKELHVFECQICSSSFRKRSEYTTHTKTHRKYMCEICGKTLRDPKGHSIHVKNHFRDNPKPYPCTEPNCNQFFCHPNTLRNHIMAIHRGLKPYLCQTCGFETGHNAALQAHIRIHTGEKPYKCDFPDCGYSAATNGALKQHAGRHTNHRSYKCNLIENGVECGKGFNTRTTLRTHMLYHQKRLDPENAPEIPKRLRKSKKRKAEELAIQQQQQPEQPEHQEQELQQFTSNSNHTEYSATEQEENTNRNPHMNINQVPNLTIPNSIPIAHSGSNFHQTEFLFFP